MKKRFGGRIALAVAVLIVLSLLFGYSSLAAAFYSVNVSEYPKGAGSVFGGGNNYAEGSTVTVYATTIIGTRFVGWTEDGNIVSTNASYSFKLTEDRTLVAQFQDSANTYGYNGAYGYNNPYGYNSQYGYYDSNGNWVPYNSSYNSQYGYYDSNGNWIPYNSYNSTGSYNPYGGYYDSNGNWVPNSSYNGTGSYNPYGGYYDSNGNYVPYNSGTGTYNPYGYSSSVLGPYGYGTYNTTPYGYNSAYGTNPYGYTQPTPTPMPTPVPTPMPTQTAPIQTLPAAVPSDAAQQQSNVIVMGIIMGDDVPVRGSASSSGSSLGYLQSGSDVTVLGYQNNFMLIKWDNATGYAYVSADNLNVTFANPLQMDITGRVYVQSRMNTAAKYRIETLNNGDTAAFTGRYKQWWVIETSEGTGYVKNVKYIEQP